MMCDNQGAIALVKNPCHHSRTKYIDIRYHFISKKVECGMIEMKYICMEYMIANVLTKALGKP